MVKGDTSMKCPKCGGNAELSNWGSYVDPDYADYHVECEKCGYHSMGSTEPNKAKEMFEKGMGMYYTNEAWIKQCTTEQLAEFLADQYNDVVDFILREVDEHAGDIDPDDYWYRQGVVAEWLKQPHTPKE